jgi:hypothetical protein
MSDQQCGLCLSCGAPFLPDIGDIDFFNRQGNLSLLFLNTEFQNNLEVRRIFLKPSLLSKRHQAHVFHGSHHATAIEYMCTMHTHDRAVGGGVVPVDGGVVPNQFNAPLLYFHAPTSKGEKGPQAATWDRPARADRLKMSSLLAVIIQAANRPSARPIEQNLEQTYLTCDRCNYVMTQQADFRFLLGYRPAGMHNTRGTIIQGRPITQYRMVAHGPLLTAYGQWAFKNPPAAPVPRPNFSQVDSEAPHIAYYLHMCLPFKRNGHAHDVFHEMIPDAPLMRSARKLYVEQCWLIMEIACLALSVEEGRVATVLPLSFSLFFN